MNYQHFYHAGSAADVFKHSVLIAVLEHFKQKAKPFCVIDTHAGAGEYDLTAISTKQEPEWHSGIKLLKGKLLQHPCLQHYQNLTSNLKHYPGSPKIAQQLLRADDELHLIEMANAPYSKLRTLFKNDRRVHVHQQDAYASLKALLPPAIRRGMVLVDPPYESPEEITHLTIALNESLRRWATATYIIWYPVKTYTDAQRLQRKILQSTEHDVFVTECCWWPDDVPTRLNGSGLLFINPPWGLAETLQTLLKELQPLLSQHSLAQQRCFWLKQPA